VSDISITYDLLFDVLRVEKSRDDLQKLDEKFYRNVVEYINSKESVVSNPNTPHSERELTRIQLGNVRKLLMELYDRREKKIINLDIYKIKTSSGMIMTDGLSEEEKPLFERLYSELSRYRSSTINNIVEGKNPVLESVRVQASSMPSNNSASATNNIEDRDYAAGSVRSVRFIRPVPRFLGPELETYGPFEEDDIASLPSKIADILVDKERAENINIE